MRQKYYQPKWKMYQYNITRDTLRNNTNLRRFVRIRKTLFAVNFIASIVLLTIIFMGVL